MYVEKADSVTGLITDNETVFLDVPPSIINDRTCLPIRAVAEAFGAKVDWDDKTKTVIIETGV